MARRDAAYQVAYDHLNAEQKQAVDTLDGPLLVVAGPGSGKTQLLSTRVGRILKKTDANALNILCLTFSESAVSAMKERLNRLIGPESREVNVSTYHGFGRDLITSYPDLFQLAPNLRPADDLILDKVLRSVLAELDYSNPLKDEFYLNDLKSLISGYKRALITPDKLRTIIAANERFRVRASSLVQATLPNDRIKKAHIQKFEELLIRSHGLKDEQTALITPLKQLWLEQLEAALDQVKLSTKLQPLSAWKNNWLEKDKLDNLIVKSPRLNHRQIAFAEIYQRYLDGLAKHSIYDYDDMIRLAIEGLSSTAEIKYTLQERYQYIQLDEFQDTNEMQLKIVELLADNPTNEGRPNILAVGDDDQAIYSFQGAHYSHMERFMNRYTDVKLIKLKTNYRSTASIVSFAGELRSQIQDGLSLGDKLQQANDPNVKGEIVRVELPRDTEELSWTADYVARLIKGGLNASDIAVIAPKHSMLVEFVPYLHAKQVAVSYEQRDNILDDPLINQILSVIRLILLLGSDPAAADTLWPQVISQPQWQLPTSLIWQLSWQARDEQRHWSDLLLQNPKTRALALFLIHLNQIAPQTPFEQMISYLIGASDVKLSETRLESYTSPFYEHYLSSLSPDSGLAQTAGWHLLSHLTTLCAAAKNAADECLNLKDFWEFCDNYKKAGLKLIDTTSYQESASAVNLMSAHGAKGQEYDTVILLHAVDSAWGHSARRQSLKIALPQNLKQVHLDQSSDDEKLRLLFVAASRAKRRLVLPSYVQTLDNKPAEPIAFLNETSAGASRTSPLLPLSNQKIGRPIIKPQLTSRSALWHDPHLDNFRPERRALLQDRLIKFALTATNLNTYTNVIDGGPTNFYLSEILKFPQAQSPRSHYGSAMHATLDWQFRSQQQNGSAPTLKQVQAQFETILKHKGLTNSEFTQLLKRGKSALKAYLAQTKISFNPQDLSEESLSVNFGEARLRGTLDRLIVDKQKRTLRIIDFKTGGTYERWNSDLKPYHHKRQLYFYKLLIESSPKFKGYDVASATLQFVEPNEDDGQIQSLDLEFNQTEEEELQKLIGAVWTRIMSLDFMDVERYPKSVKGIAQFEADLKQPDAKMTLNSAKINSGRREYYG